MATAFHNLSDYDFNSVPDASQMRFGIVVSEWNHNITGAEAKNLTKIGIEELKAAGLTNGKELVKVLGNGELKAKLEVEANAFSKTAEEAIKAVGGNATII